MRAFNHLCSKHKYSRFSKCGLEQPDSSQSVSSYYIFKTFSQSLPVLSKHRIHDVYVNERLKVIFHFILFLIHLCFQSTMKPLCLPPNHSTTLPREMESSPEVSDEPHQGSVATASTAGFVLSPWVFLVGVSFWGKSTEPIKNGAVQRMAPVINYWSGHIPY